MSIENNQFLNSLNKKTNIILFLAAGVILFGFSGWMWWQNIYLNPERAFWAMLNTSLSTTSVTKHTESNSSGGSMVQDNQLTVGAQNLVHGKARVIQKSSVGETIVGTETISTMDAEYARYTEIKVPNSNKKTEDNVKAVLNIWGKSTVEDKTQVSRTLAKSLLNITADQPSVPISYVQPQQRSQLLQFMKDKNVYKVDFSTPPKQKVEEGKNVYVYKVKINVSQYVAMLNMYGKAIGIGDVGFNPASYKDTPDVEADFSVDPVSRQLLVINYPDQSFRESYRSYGANTTFEVPSKTISLNDLQTKIQNLQQ